MFDMAVKGCKAAKQLPLNWGGRSSADTAGKGNKEGKEAADIGSQHSTRIIGKAF